MTRRTQTGKGAESVIATIVGSAGSDSRRPLLIMAVLTGVCIVACFVFLGVAAILQLGDPGNVESDVARVAVRNDSFVGNRGTLFDSTGHRVLAVTVSDMSVKWLGGGPNDDFMMVANGLATALNVEPEPMYRKLLENIGKGVVIKRHLSEIEEEQIRLQSLPSVVLIPDKRRYYPLEVVAGSTLGYLAPDEEKANVMTGRIGVEQYYNSILSPKTRKVRIGRTSNIASRRGTSPGDGWLLDGADLDLTIDARLQIVLDNALYGAMVRERATGGMAVMLDAKTFDVLAMSSYPFLDPNRYQESCGYTDAIDDGSSACTNKVLTYRYEPGSVAKAFSLAAGLESGLRLSTVVNGHDGRCRIGKQVITDLIPKGEITLSDAIKFSSNCAMQEMARKLAPEYLQNMYVRLGIGQRSGIDMPDRADSSIQRRWTSIDARSASYGYGFRGTLLNLAVAYATFTNDGVRQEPRVVRRIRMADGTAETVERPEGVRVVSKSTAAGVRSALRRVVMEQDGTGAKGRPTLYSAAGKTGTARMAGTTREDKKFHCSFAGFAPAADPRVVIAVTVINPKVHFSGGAVAAPVFAEVVDNALPILGIAPEFRPEPDVSDSKTPLVSEGDNVDDPH